MFLKLNMVRGTIVDEDEQEVEVTTPVSVRVDQIRSFNPRKEGKPGTRLTFLNGRGFAVTESYESVAEHVAYVG